jgi:hypothetical protein
MLPLVLPGILGRLMWSAITRPRLRRDNREALLSGATPTKTFGLAAGKVGPLLRSSFRGNRRVMVSTEARGRLPAGPQQITVTLTGLEALVERIVDERLAQALDDAPRQVADG